MSIITKKLLIATAAALFALTGAYGAAAADKHELAGAGGQNRTGVQQHSKAQQHGNGRVRHAQRGNARRNGNGSQIVGQVIRGILLFADDSEGSCGYSYRKWHATGSRYWRSRYYDCLNG
jgi:hypothetical protein